MSGFAEAQAEDTAGADGIQRLQNLIARVPRVCLRMEPGGDTITGIAHEADVDDYEHRRGSGSRQQPFRIRPGNVHHHHRHHAHEQDCGKVLFQCQGH